MSANIVPSLYVHDENDWASRAAWAWWHWLDETWLGWWQFGRSDDGRWFRDTWGTYPELEDAA